MSHVPDHVDAAPAEAPPVEAPPAKARSTEDMLYDMTMLYVKTGGNVSIVPGDVWAWFQAESKAREEQRAHLVAQALSKLTDDEKAALGLDAKLTQ